MLQIFFPKIGDFLVQGQLQFADFRFFPNPRKPLQGLFIGVYRYAPKTWNRTYNSPVQTGLVLLLQLFLKQIVSKNALSLQSEASVWGMERKS